MQKRDMFHMFHGVGPPNYFISETPHFPLEMSLTGLLLFGVKPERIKRELYLYLKLFQVCKGSQAGTGAV